MNDTRLSLNIELTDEQYQELMSKSLDAVLNTEQIRVAITDLVLKHIGDYLQRNQDAVTEFVKPPHRYGNTDNEQHRAIVKNLFENATKEYQETIQKVVNEYMCDLLTKVDCNMLIQNILHEVLVSTTQDALREIMNNQAHELWNNIGHHQMAIQNLASRLNVDVGYCGV